MHKHWCEVEGHWYDCIQPCVCECGRSLEGNDHSGCCIELRACPEHQKAVSVEAADENKFLADWFPTEEERRKHDHAQGILRQLVFYDLSLFNDDLDSAAFFEEDFFKAVARCECLGIGIHGIDVFSTERGYLGTKFYPEGEQGLSWCRISLTKWLGRTDTVFSATYDVPDRFLEAF